MSWQLPGRKTVNEDTDFIPVFWKIIIASGNIIALKQNSKILQ
jgi:hypothetical protein